MNKLLQNTAGVGLASVGRLVRRRFIASTQRAQTVNDQLLYKILKLNQDTEYGRRHQFAAIQSTGEFKAALPLTTYADYQAEIERMAQGEQNILTAEPVRYFSLSSGTTGQQKMIPATPRSIRSAASVMAFLMYGMLRHHLADGWHYGRGLNLMNLTIAGQTPSGIPKSAATAGGMRSMQGVIPLLWTSPVEMLKPTGKTDTSYLHLRFALEEENLAYLCAPFISSLLDLLRYLEQHWPRLVADVAQGTIDPTIEMPPQLRATLQQRLHPNPRRAVALKAEFEQGFSGIVQRIWPRVLYISSVAGGGFRGYTEKIKMYTQSVPIYSGSYAASEGIVGICHSLNQPTYVVMPETSYFEFIPFSDVEQAQPQTLNLSELTVGESYEVVLTSFSGLYRYRLADIIRVTGYYQATPELEFLYRRNQLLNLVAEKTSEMAAQHAVQATFAQSSVRLVDFTVMADINRSPGCYVFYVEVEGDHPSVDTQAQARLDHELGLANPSYASARRAGKLCPAELKIVRPGTFAGLKTLLLVRGASANQIKIPRVVKDTYLIDYLQKWEQSPDKGDGIAKAMMASQKR